MDERSRLDACSREPALRGMVAPGPGVRLREAVPRWDYITVVIRTTGNPADLAPPVRRLVWSRTRNLPVSDVLTLEEVV